MSTCWTTFTSSIRHADTNGHVDGSVYEIVIACIYFVLDYVSILSLCLNNLICIIIDFLTFQQFLFLYMLSAFKKTRRRVCFASVVMV